MKRASVAGLLASALFCAPAICASGAATGPESPPAPNAQRPVPPTDVQARDHPWDGGEDIDVAWKLSADDAPGAGPKRVLHYKVLRSGEKDGLFDEVGAVEPTKRAYRKGRLGLTVKRCERGEPYYFRVVAVGPGKAESAPAQVGPVRATRQLFGGARFWIGIITVLLCGAVIYWIRRARKGKPLKVRKIAGLEAVDEAVGRATEMGRACLFIPGIQDMNDIQTIAGLTVLGRVAKTAAEYGARVEVPTCRSLVMTAARETVQAAFLGAGRPDAYNQDLIYYVTDEQFGYVAYLTGMMVREKPAACFYMGPFFAEALILAETGNSVGAIQVAGTAMPAQLPFFVAACDYTLIGEEFFAASAYLSGEPEQLGSLKGQDVGKIVIAVLLVGGCALATLAVLAEPTAYGDMLAGALEFLKETVLK